MTEVDLPTPALRRSPDVELDPTTATVLRDVARIMIPAWEEFPDAGAITVDFVSRRAEPPDVTFLAEALAGLRAPDPSRLRDFECSRPADFAVLRWWVYSAYYSSPVVIGLMQLAGSRYHGAPQPLGYRIDVDAPVPATPRGTYQRTEEVTRVRL
jgi:hypothetical protein